MLLTHGIAISVLIVLLIVAAIAGPQTSAGKITIGLFSAILLAGFVAAPTITVVAIIKSRKLRGKRSPAKELAKKHPKSLTNPIDAARSKFEAGKAAAAEAITKAKADVTDLGAQVPGVEIAKRSVEALRHATTTYHRATSPTQSPASSQSKKYEAPLKTSIGEDYWILGSNAYKNLELKGEFAYIAGIQKAIGKTPKLDEEVVVEDLSAELFPEPTNRHDSHATAVYINEQLVGYLSHEDAILYRPQLDVIAKAGQRAMTKANVWIVARKDWQTGKKKFYSNIRVAMAPPGQIIPLNNPPELPYSLIPWGSAIQVMGEENHLAELTEYLSAGTESIVLGTLHLRPSTHKSGTVQEFIEVYLDGHPIGTLTKTTSAHFIPIVKHLGDQGLATAVWMKLKGNEIAAQLAIQSQRGHEISSDWFGTVHKTSALYKARAGMGISTEDAELSRDTDEIREFMKNHEPMWDDEAN